MNRSIQLTSAAEVFVFCLVLILLPIAAPAQSQPGDFGVFATAEGTGSSLEVLPFTPFTVHILAFDLEFDIAGFEFLLPTPPEVIILAATTWDSWMGGIPPLHLPDARVSWSCRQGEGTVWLMTVQYFFTGSAQETDMLLCLQAHPEPTPALDGRPGYVSCEWEPIPFNYAQSGGPHYPDGCLVINPTHPDELPVATESAGFGALKARFTTHPDQGGGP